MSPLITYETIERFSVKLKYNLFTYIDLYNYFIHNSQPNITQYYQVQGTVPDANSFNFLQDLIDESVKVNNLMKINAPSFDKIDDWELLDFLEEVATSLQTINNTYKYTRSSKSQNSWRVSGITVEHILGDNETIEQVVVNELQSTNSQNDWTGLAISNNLLEIDYEADSSTKLLIQKGVSTSQFLYLDSVVDVLQGMTLYGKDWSRKIQFIEDDINTLSYIDTFIQSINVLISLNKGDIPEFTTLGKDPSICIGTNVNVFNFGQLAKQLASTFNTDDTIRNFSLKELFFKDDGAYITYVVDSFYNLTYSQTIKL